MNDDGYECDGGAVTATGNLTPTMHDETSGSFGERVRQIAVIADQEYRLSLRTRWALALTGLMGLFAVLVVGFGGTELGPARVDAVVVSLASLATYLVPLAALAFGYDAVVGAEEDGWLGVLFALPMPRWCVVVGTYLGRGITLAGATAIGFGAAGLIVVYFAGVGSIGLYAMLLLGVIGLGLAFLSIAVLVSTVAAEKTHALGLVLLVWVWFVFVHDLTALGLIAALDLPTTALSTLVLTNPADIFRVVVLQHAGATGGGFAAVYADVGLTVPVLVAALVVWCLVPVAIASRLVRRRSV